MSVNSIECTCALLNLDVEPAIIGTASLLKTGQTKLRPALNLPEWLSVETRGGIIVDLVIRKLFLGIITRPVAWELGRHWSARTNGDRERYRPHIYR